MGSALSSTVAEIYLQYFEKLTIKHWIETEEIIYYKTYVDDIFIIFNRNKIIEDSITKRMKNLHKFLEFKQTVEEHNTINHLDRHIHRNNNNIQLGIYRKPIQSDTNIHFASKHPLQHQLAAYSFYIHRLLPTPITESAKQQGWNTVCTLAKNNGFPLN
jgi:hypothetical protein